MGDERLLTSWGEYESAVAQALSDARRTVRIFDRDLTAFKFETPDRQERLAAFLRQPGACLRIAAQCPRPALDRSPRLMALLRLHAHNFQLLETAPHLALLSDSLLLVDDATAVVRFHRDQARSKLIVGDVAACQPYGKRFEEIWAEGGTPLSATSLGL